MERLTDIPDVGRIILQQREVGEREKVQVLFRSHIRKGIHEDPPLPPPGEVRDREEVFFLLKNGSGQFQHGNFRFAADDPINAIEVFHDFLMKKTGRNPSEKDVDVGKSSFQALGSLHHIKALMVPMKIEGHHPGCLLLDIVEKGKIVIFDPFHPRMHNLGGNVIALEKVSQSEESHGQEVDPDEFAQGPIIVFPFRDMEEETVHFSHRGQL
jgi:hypothetical protein